MNIDGWVRKMMTSYSQITETSNNFKPENDQSLEILKYHCIFGQFETPIYWGNLVLITALHLVTVYQLLHFDYFGHPFFFIYSPIIGALGAFGITAGAHRYWTHRCFKAKLPLKLILLMCYSIAGQNTILDWVRDHRVHHKFSETDADPHNSHRGFLFSHVGWLCMKKHPQVLRKGRLIDVSDISSDPLLAFHIKYWFWFKLCFCFILPTIIPPLVFNQDWWPSIWSNLIRYCLSLNFTWSVNSFAHIWGSKPYNRHIRPVENKLVSFVSFGEGWHNYHHSFPWDYRAAEIGNQPNFTTFCLDLFAKIGWAYDLKTTSSDLVRRMVRVKGDGTGKIQEK